MRAFAETIDAISAARGRLEKTALLARYLASRSDEDLDAVARFLSGAQLPPGEQAQAAIGSKTITAAAQKLYGFDNDALREKYREFGDLSEAIAACYREPLDLGFFAEHLTPARLLAHLRDAANARGKNANLSRTHIVETILRACASARKVAAIVKVLTGELRIGSREGLVVDAIAQAFERPVEDVRRALAANVDAGIVALAARHNDLHEITPSYGVAVGPMLASPMPLESTFKELTEGEWLYEDKYDGIRAQIHVNHADIEIFSRTGGNITESFPELRAACAHAVDTPCMLDGEILAMQDGRPLPFRTLQPRLSRKDPSAQMQSDIPVAFVAFDLLAHHNTMLIDEPLHERRERLDTLLAHWRHPLLLRSEHQTLAQPYSEYVPAAFAAARARGNEGVMFKRHDSLYTPGRRGKSWLKLKQELDTLDVVVVGVEWGHGKRVKMLSDYTFAVQGPSGLLKIGKAYSGLTDAEIIELTPWFQERQTGMLGKRTIAVQPELVIEIAFDVLQPSDANESGYSLRFPRIVRIRQDKTPAQINTIADVEAIYRSMLAREGEQT